jgi:hypothetical protein
VRPVFEDILDAFNDLEPRGRFTTSVTYWQDGTMQLITHSVARDAGYKIEAYTAGTISDRTMRRHLRKLEACAFTYKRGPVFPSTTRKWAARGVLQMLRWAGEGEAADEILEKLEAAGVRLTKEE